MVKGILNIMILLVILVESNILVKKKNLVWKCSLICCNFLLKKVISVL